MCSLFRFFSFFCSFLMHFFYSFCHVYGPNCLIQINVCMYRPTRGTMRLSCTVFRVIASYLSKVADFNPPHLHLAPPQRAIPVEFRGDLSHEKSRLPGLSCGVVYLILCLAVLVEHRLVTDTDRQTDRAIAYTALA